MKDQLFYWRDPLPDLKIEEIKAVMDPDGKQETVPHPFSSPTLTLEETLWQSPSLTNQRVLVTLGSRLERKGKRVLDFQKAVEDDLTRAMDKSERFDLLACQQIGKVGDDIRVDFIFGGEDKAAAFCADIKPTVLTCILVMPSDLGLDLEPILTESDMMHIKRISDRSNVFSTALDVKVEQVPGGVQARFLSVAELNQFLLTHGRSSETETAEKCFGCLRRQMALRPKLSLVHDGKGSFNLYSINEINWLVRKNFGFRQAQHNRNLTSEYYIFSFRDKMKLFSFLFSSECRSLNFLQFGKKSKVVEIEESLEEVSRESGCKSVLDAKAKSEAGSGPANLSPSPPETLEKVKLLTGKGRVTPELLTSTPTTKSSQNISQGADASKAVSRLQDSWVDENAACIESEIPRMLTEGDNQMALMSSLPSCHEVQRLIRSAANPSQRSLLFDRVTRHFPQLAQQSGGHMVVQAVLLEGSQDQRELLIKQLENKDTLLSLLASKEGSTVASKCLPHFQPDTVAAVVTGLLDNVGDLGSSLWASLFMEELISLYEEQPVVDLLIEEVLFRLQTLSFSEGGHGLVTSVITNQTARLLRVARWLVENICQVMQDQHAGSLLLVVVQQLLVMDRTRAMDRLVDSLLDTPGSGGEPLLVTVAQQQTGHLVVKELATQQARLGRSRDRLVESINNHRGILQRDLYGLMVVKGMGGWL